MRTVTITFEGETYNLKDVAEVAPAMRLLNAFITPPPLGQAIFLQLVSEYALTDTTQINTLEDFTFQQAEEFLHLYGVALKQQIEEEEAFYEAVQKDLDNLRTLGDEDE